MSAKQAGVDRGAIQAQIDSLLPDIKNEAGASAIKELNSLSVDMSANGYNVTKTVVASFERADGGTVAVFTDDHNMNDAMLHHTDVADNGIMDPSRATLCGGAETLSGATINSLTVSTGGLTTLDADLATVDAATNDAIRAAKEAGVSQSRMTNQSTFISVLVDANDTTVGALVDANIKAQSAELRALQARQQLAIRSLSTANPATQNILTLFR